MVEVNFYKKFNKSLTHHYLNITYLCSVTKTENIMAIYTEQTDPNESAGLETTNKQFIIDEINEIIEEYGDFTIYSVDADNSPFVEAKGNLTHLMEDFREGGGTVYVYDPRSCTSEQIDEYDEFYEDMHITQLEYILELAQKWAEINEE